MEHRTSRPGRTTALTGLAVAALLAAGCGSASDNEADDPTDDTTPQGVSATDHTIAPVGEPSYGGTLVYALEAETDGYLSSENRWAISGTMVAGAIYDPLTALDADAVPRPFLAESVEPNDDFTSWTIGLREGVDFHDGTPVDAAAVVANLEAHRESFLTGSALAPVTAVEALDDLTVRVDMAHPWSTFDATLTFQVGYVQAPSQLEDPDGNRNPVGSGPFVFGEWVTDSSLTTTRNEDYWQDGLPYLDGVEFRPVKVNDARVNQLVAGQIDVMHTDDHLTVADLRERAEADEIQLVEDRGEGEENFIMLNMAEAPVDDVRVRRALAMATDLETYNESIDLGIPAIAQGPFNESSPWHVETDYPGFDLDAATALVQEYESEVGPVVITISTADGQRNLEAVQALQAMWERAGVEVHIASTDQTNFIGETIAGQYQAALWRQFGAPDPDVDLVWWQWKTSDGAENFLNFARLFDEEVDDALMRGRTSSEPAERKAAYADLQHRLSELVPYVWLNHSVWAIAAGNHVRGITNGPLPDGSPSLPLGGTGSFGGTHRLTQMWIEEA